MNGANDMTASAGDLKPVAPRTIGGRTYLLWGIAALAVWWLEYHSLAPFAAWLTYSLCGLAKGSHLGSAVEFFVYESPKVLLPLLTLALGILLVGYLFNLLM